MAENNLTAIYFCKLSNGHTDVVDNKDVENYAKKIPNVRVTWQSAGISLTNPDFIVKQIKENNLSRIIIAGDEAGMYKPFFTKALVKAGGKPNNVILASFKEHGALKKSDTDRAKAIVACAVYGVAFEEAAKPDIADVNPNTLVIGGGIAGIQASLEIAGGNQKVFLVEKSGTIGGHMAMFDKTFPTLDCAACILTPKMVDVGQHPNIELMTYSEIRSVEGVPGDYKVKVLKKAKFVDVATCIGCGTCAEKCPVKVPSEFDSETSLRKAIYIPFPQAVPNKYILDAEHCRYIQEDGKCGVCQKVCPVPNCIDYNCKDEEVEINVGNIIVATGFKTFDAKKADQFGYGKFPNVLTSLELERLINAAGPTEGNIISRTQDKKGNWIFQNGQGEIPNKVAVIHCVGSRDENHNKYCSKVCCMYSLKLAHLVKEKLPKAEVSEFYIDMRAFGKGYEEFYERINNEGINIIRGRTATVEQCGEQLRLRSEDIEGAKIIEENFDMVILAVGLEATKDSIDLAKMLGLTVDQDGWMNESNYISDPVNTFTGGISIAGVCQGPKDIPDTVAQASAAASRVIQSILNGKINKSIKDLSLEYIESRAKELSTIMEEKV
ncbi:MAG: CoB--CoM heterodisulfide reductase iron-sulfur subunit A family protein [Saprospiraceae bacterium]|nr:CoB--CoM heterodisulfide reductase iron-sulfur subunit A family protein [Saprospiraceae bacterium]